VAKAGGDGCLVRQMWLKVCKSDYGYGVKVLVGAQSAKHSTKNTAGAST